MSNKNEEINDNKNIKYEKLENENIELTNLIKQLENKTNILTRENTLLKQMIHEKEELLSKFQKYYLDAKTKLVYLLDENKKLIKEHKKMKEELENRKIERKVEEKSKIKEMNEKVNTLKKEITRINTYYGTQLIEKNAKIKNLEDNNTKLEGQLIQTISFNLIGENPINSQLNNNLDLNDNLYNSTVNQNIFNDYNKVQCLSATKKKSNRYKFYRNNNTQDFNSYSEKKNVSDKNLNGDNSYYLKLYKNRNRNERNFLAQTYRGNYISEYNNQIREKMFSPQPIEDKKRINDKFQKLISKFE